MKVRKGATEKAQKVKMILLDVDGVLTDGSIIYSSNCGEIKVFNAQDGFGIVRAIELGLKVFITPGIYNFLAHHGPSFITEVMPWLKEIIDRE